MTMTSIGDLALSFQLRRQNTLLKVDLNRFSQELSSGVTKDIGARLKGNFNIIAGLERGISVANSYLVGISEQRLESSTAQNALEKLRVLGQISEPLLTAQETGNQTLVRSAGRDALERFAASIETLNTQIGGRSIFSGIATDRLAVTDAQVLLTTLESEISAASAVTAEEVAMVVDDWFTPGGGYDTVGYTGGAAAAVGVRLSDSEIASPTATAQDDRLRAYLSALAKGALIGRGTLDSDPTEQGKLARLSGESLMSADAKVVDLMSSIGVSEAQVERANLEVRSEIQGLELARNELVAIDPFETAVRLENAETQLQTLYAVTARLSGLSLANYL